MPGRFERVAAAFEEAAHVQRPCSESPTETDLSELVASFMERDGGCDARIAEDSSGESYSSDSEAVDRLRSLLGRGKCKADSAGSEGARERVLSEVEAACRIFGDVVFSDEFKLRLMSRLRERGFDAGFCKSTWEKTARFPAGEYNFLDVNVNGVNYIVEVGLSKQFETARCSKQYRQLLDVFPPVFVGQKDGLKQIVHMMCSLQKQSMKKTNLHVPPWRRTGYMLAKWFGSYERSTTLDIQARETSQVREFSGARRPIQFSKLPEISYYCREDFATKTGLRIGYLSAAFKGK